MIADETVNVKFRSDKVKSILNTRILVNFVEDLVASKTVEATNNLISSCKLFRL